MILCKYSKREGAAFIPHLDILRAVGFSIRRAGLKIESSEGFNPHMQLYFNQPLPIGTESLCEYFCAYSPESAQNFLSELNRSLPRGIEILKAKNLESNPNIAAIIAKADYEIVFNGDIDIKKAIKILKRDEVVINYEAKGELVSKNVSELIYQVTGKDKVLKVRVACGNVNLRADRLAGEVLKQLGNSDGYKVVKTAAYLADDVNIDKFFN